jgi:microcystin degradation protein MlrC
MTKQPSVSKLPRIAFGGFMLESNNHSPVATEAEFRDAVLLEAGELLADIAKPAPAVPPTVTGFTHAMDGFGPWQKLPLIMAAVGASGPVDQPFFEWVVRRMVEELERHIREGGPLDAVFLSQHGAAIATGDIDPDGTLFRAVRAVIGPDVPLLCTLDLHANVNQTMVDLTQMMVSYRCNPHTDMADRGADCARHLQRLLAGERPARGFQKLPFIPPSTSQNTKAGPYADLIAFGQQYVGGEVWDVSINSGFSLGDTPKNGMSVIVTADTQDRADQVAREVAAQAWATRHNFVARLTSIEDCAAMAVAASRDPAKPALLFADVADNPGGGGGGNTPYLLEAFHKAGVEGCALGPFFDPELAAEAHRLGEGVQFPATFNRKPSTEFSGTLTLPGRVVKLSDGLFVGRRGMAAGRQMDMGKAAAIQVGGITVVVTTYRHQALDPMFFESLGIDLRKLRSLIVKSRGHFRAGFDDIFSDAQIIEADAPGLTTPMLQRVPWREVPRPIFPLDPEMEWAPA